ncbi:MAG: universal stress protein [Blastocatellia bacterium]
MKILICSDGSTQADNAITFGGLIAAACAAETTVLGIAERSGDEAALFDALRHAQQTLKDRGINAEVAIKSGDPVDEILDRTRHNEYDLVVIGAVKKGKRGPFLMSAKAYRIIKSVEPPVLVVIGEKQSVQRILICSGGERYIDRAVGITGRFAKPLGAKVSLLHVMAQPPALYADMIRMKDDPSLLLQSDSDLGRNLRREKDSLEQIGVECDVRIRQGLVVNELFREIAAGDYDLVVAGSSPVGDALRTYIMGNITREIVNRANCPVLVVRGNQQPTGLAGSLKGIISEITHAFSHQKD